MSEFIVIAQLFFLVVFYILIMHTSGVIYTRCKERQNKPEVMSSEDDINITKK